MDDRFSNPSYPLMYNSSNNSISFFSNTLNESWSDNYKNAQELFDAYFSRDKKKKEK